ncbi:hypothetical protein UFOVP907_39 [uncultured Caudovirales phage]|uniref:Uncharacterized protein n=1 Tax=uncultured Caudovirales phage TaxID=2100421 RepID=A0A6J5PG04_9CAUD|nr:hypothetical protein UFOVP907_39 [uncultured Caudovirales phage]
MSAVVGYGGFPFSLIDENAGDAPPTSVRGVVPLINQRKTCMKYAQNNFDFDAFNAVTAKAPAGLKLYLAQQLMSNVLFTMQMYDNPRADDVHSIFADIKALRSKTKDDAAARERASGSAKIDSGERG